MFYFPPYLANFDEYFSNGVGSTTNQFPFPGMKKISGSSRFTISPYRV